MTAQTFFLMRGECQVNRRACHVQLIRVSQHSIGGALPLSCESAWPYSAVQLNNNRNKWIIPITGFWMLWAFLAGVFAKVREVKLGEQLETRR